MAFTPAPTPAIANEKQFVTVSNLTPTSINSAAWGVQTFTVTGLDPIAHQFLSISSNPFVTSTGLYTAQPSGMIVVNAFVSAANTLSIVFFNNGSTGAPQAGWYSIVVD